MVVYKPPKLLTEREVRIAGATSNRLLNLRHMLSEVRSGSLTVTTKSGTVSQTLSSVELEAILALLIERDEALLVGLNIELER